MPKVVDAQAQRRQIRSAAQHVFSRRGVSGTGLTHVAEAVGMGRSSLYHYYPDKASLVRDLVRDLLVDEERVFRAALQADVGALERIERLAGRLAEMFEEWSRAGRMIFDLRASDARLFRPFFKRVRRELAAVIAEGQASGEVDPGLQPELAAATLIGAVDGLLLQRLVDPRAFPDVAALRGELVRLARRSLAP
ncbi:MAG: TetR/AcrR family transcriptional regulator [Myxococcota bacterium]